MPKREKKSNARKTSDAPTRVWKFAAKIERESVPTALEIALLSQRYYNRLVEVERARHERFVAIRRRYAPELAAIEDKYLELDDAILALYKEAKRGRACEWRESKQERTRTLPPEFEARKSAIEASKKELSESGKTHRAAFDAMLEPSRAAMKLRVQEAAKARRYLGKVPPRIAEQINPVVRADMLAEPEWHDAWKEIVQSDAEAHEQMRVARVACGLHNGTYLGVEAAFERAKKDCAPRPPGFKRFDGQGRVLVQVKKSGTVRDRWSTLKAPGLRVERIDWRAGERRSRTDPNLMRGSRSNMVRVTFDQTRGDGPPMVVSVVCKLHREPPADAVVKWVGLVVRRIGRRHACQLQVTMDHASLSESRHPPGSHAPEHVYLGWSKEDDGIRVAYWRGGSVVCPSAILEQAGYSEETESFVDGLRVQAVDRIVGWLTRAGHDPDRQRLGSDRSRAFLRRGCEAYARHVLGDVTDKWREWVASRRGAGLDLYVPYEQLRATMSAREAGAWWCWLWARKDAHLEQLVSDSRRRFENRRDAHYRAEAIRIATEFSSVTVDGYSIADFKQKVDLTTSGDGTFTVEGKHLPNSQLQAAAPGRFREILIEVMGPRCSKSGRTSEQSGGAQSAGGARKKKGKKVRADPDGARSGIAAE